MAISGGDGSIILTTKVDTSGISKGSISIRSALQSVDTTVKKVQTSFSAFREQKVTLATLNQAIKDQQYVLNSLNLEYAEYVARGKASSTEAKQLKSNIDALTVEMREMEGAAATLGAKGSASINKLGIAMRSLLSYFIGIQTIFKVINFSGEAAQFATQTGASVQRLVDIYGEASQVVGDFIDQNARAIGLSRASASSFASSYGNIFSAFSDQKTNAELTNEFLNLTAVIASKTGRTLEETQEKIKSGLFGNLRAIDDLGIFVRQTALESSEAFRKLAGDRSWEQLSSQEQQQIRAYAIMEQGVQKYGNTVMKTTALTRSQYQAAYEDFQNTWGQVVNTVLIPVLKILTQVFTIATKGLQVMAGLGGKTVENSGQTSSNIKQQTKEQEKLNKAVKRGVAEFDEINTSTKQSAENTADAGTGTQISGIGGGGGTLNGSSYVEEVDATLMAIMGIVAEAMIAVGLILLFTGHIGWGIGFIIAGAATLTVTMASASEFGYDGIIQMLTTIMGVAGGALLALGIILVYFKILPTGIGMIVAGASLIVSSVAMQGTFNPDDIASWLSIIMGIAGGALLAIGIFLCYMKVYPQGIGLIIAGATSLISAVALGSEDITEKIKGWVAAIMAIAGAALLVLGIVLTCTGNFILGIPLIALGAVALVTPIALNWDAIWDAITGTFNAIIDWIKTYGLLVLGIILCLTGAGIPLGIALIIKWAKDGAEKGVPLATAIVDKVKEIWNAIKNFWNTHIAPIFTAEWWKNLGKKVMNGLIAGFEAGINGIIGMFEKMINWVVNGLNKISFDVPDWVPGIGGKTFGFNLQQVKFGRVSIPRLAQGAVIPPNREFLAVLGDQKQGRNIETPESLLRDIYAEGNAETNALLQQLIQVMQKGMTVNVDGKQLMRINREAETRVGRQTVTGGFANAY